MADQNLTTWCQTYQSFWHVVGAGETNAYVFTPAAAQRTHVWIGADIAGAAGIDTAKNNAIETSTATFTTPTVTPSQSTDIALVFQMPYTGNALTWTNPAGWTLGTGPTSQWRGESLYQQLASTASVSETSTLSGNAYGFSAIVLLTASGIQPPPPTPTPTPSATPTPTPAPPPPGGPPSPAQWTSGNAYAPASITVKFPTVPTANDVLVVTLWNNAQTTCAANTYTPPAGWNVADQNLSAWCQTYQSFWHLVGAGETNAYVFTPAAAQRTHVWIGAEIAGAAGIDTAKSNAIETSTTTFTTPTVTPAHASDLALALQLPYTGSAFTWTNPTGWTLGTGPTSQWRGEALYQPLSSTAAVSETSTLSGSAYGFSSILLLTSSGAPSPTPSPPVAYTDWNTFGDNVQRTGYNSNETTLSPSNAGSLKQLWATDLGGPITAQPILATNVTVNSASTNVLYVGTENNAFYAVNADTGAVLWKNASFGSSLTGTCGDLPNGVFGITGTATYDRTAGVVYVADANDYLHALDMTTGAELWKTNVLLDPNTNAIVGAPSQDHIYGALTRNPRNGLIYVYTGSFCEIPPWHGRIVAIDTSTHNVVAAFFPGRTGSGKSGTAYCGGGIWGMGGASIDSATDDVYVASGNVVTTTSGGCLADSTETYPYGDAVIQLDSQLNLISYATANVSGTPACCDSDYGATPMLYSVPNCSSLQLSAKNKNGYLYTYGIGASGLTAEQQLHIGNTSDSGQFVGVPAFNPSSGLVYVGNPNAFGNFAHGLNALQQLGGGCNGLGLAWLASIGSANVTGDDNQAPTTANGVVYFTDGLDNQVWAFNAANGTQLWHSGTTIGSPCTSYGGACGVLGAATVDGRLFVGAWNHKLYAFSL